MHFRQFFRITIITALFLTACNGGGSATDETAVTPTLAESPVSPSATATSGPTRVLYIADEGVDTLRAEFEALAAQSGYSFEQQSDLASEDLDGSVRAVVLLAAMENAGELFTQHPEVGFFVTNAVAVDPLANVYPVSITQAGRDQVAFLAGYMAAVTTFDWRVGAVASAGSADLESFAAGAQYFCGWCRPVYPPYIEYPQTLTASQADAVNGQAVASAFNDAGVETVFVPAELATTDFLTPLAQAGMEIISSAEPVDGFELQWMATISLGSSVGLQALWEAMLTGQPAPTGSGGLELSNLNAAMISSGRADLVRKVAEDLQSGFIDTGISGVE